MRPNALKNAIDHALAGTQPEAPACSSNELGQVVIYPYYVVNGSNLEVNFWGDAWMPGCANG